MKPSSQAQLKIYRILDANHNRSKEALRVVEDTARFLWNDARVAKQIKSLRHQITQTLLGFPVAYADLVSSRDVTRDVGKKSVLYDSKKKMKIQDILAMNLKRAQESLRVLEEVSKVVSERASVSFQKSRFDVYELEKAIFRKF